jgi:diaminopimelate epimerase
MNLIHYEIYSGAGNDFAMVDNRESVIAFESEKDLTVKICNDILKEIDGVIFLNRPVSRNALIRMNYYNRDGSYGAMCGNGARCIAQYAIDKEIINRREFNIEAVKKIYKAEISGDNNVRIYFPPPAGYRLNISVNALTENQTGADRLNVHWFQVGSEHLVLFIDDELNSKILGVKNLDDVKVNEWGKVLRFHQDFQPEGANVNFAQIISGSKIRIRTYERGVERETLACGTGIISSAIASGFLNGLIPPIKVLVQSGEQLIVDFKSNGIEIEALSLEGSARKISEGELEV